MTRNQAVSANEVISGDHVVEVPGALPIPAGSAGVPGGASIDTIRDGQTIKQINVRCSCGQTIQIACDYDQA